MHQNATGILQEIPDLRSSLKDIAGQRVTMATVCLYPPLTSHALKTLQRQRQHGCFHADTGAKWLLDRSEACLMLASKLRRLRLRLPVLREGAFAGKPRIYSLMALCAAHLNGKVTLDSIEWTLNAFQTHSELALCEVEQALNCMQWVLLDRVGLYANALIDRVKACKEAERTAQKIRKRAKHNIQFSTVTDGIGFAAQLQRSLIRFPDRFLQYSGECAEAIHMSAEQVNRADRLICIRRERDILNALNSLQSIAYEAEPACFLKTHPAVILLSRQNEYVKLDEAGKDYLLLRVKRLARRAGISETRVVERAIRFANQNETSAGILEYLWEDNKLMVRFLKIRFVDGQKMARAAEFSILWIILPVLMAFYLFVAIRSRGVFLEILGGAFFGFIVLYGCIQSLLERLFAWIMPAKRLPRYKVIPEGTSTAVVMAVIVETKEQIDSHFRQLQIQAQAFSEASQFILLCDFPSSGQKEDNLGLALTQYGQEITDKLNHLKPNRFLFATRPRTYVQKEGKWIGFERKSGALLALNDAILGKMEGVGVYGGSLAAGTQYVLTLNEDTFLPPGEAQRLVCTLAHPYNTRYAVMQPSMATRASTLANSALARLYAKPGMRFGHDTASDVEMDVYNMGTYLGQGLYDVRRFLKAVRNLPEGMLLSHDYMEGALAGCALVSDVQALQSFPTRHSSYTKREHRRIRGLWQQLPFLFGKRDKEGNRITLNAHRRLWLIEQMMGSLVTLATTQLLAIATFSVLPFWLYLFFALVPYICPFLSFLLAVLSVLFIRKERHAYSFSIRRLFRKVMTDFILCPFDASIALDAIVRTLYRMLISKKKLQEWITKDQAEHGDAHSLLGYHAQMIPALLFNLLMVVFIRINKPNHLLSIALIAFVWFLSPFVAQRLDHRNKMRKPLFPAYWTNLCRQTYEYFVRMTRENPLPAQAIWFEPNHITRYTTLSDIAFALLSHVCARELQFIGREEAAKRISEILAAIEALPKWRGHPNSRIDLNAKNSVPDYICTLDSANICIALMVTEQALNTDIECELANRAKALWEAIDFTQLFSEDKGFFAAGIHVRTGILTQSLHSMYATRERLPSYLAIGRNQVNPDHLFKLKREYGLRFPFRHPLCASGTIQEYLWPRLFFALKPYTMEQLMMRYAVSAQKRTARKKHRPVGMSEAVEPMPSDDKPYTAYGIRETSIDPLVKEGNTAVPYVSALLAPFDEILAYDTLCDMERRGMRCNLGFYDALLCENKREKSVCAMVTLHQGIVLCALTNLLTDDKIAKWAAKSIPIATMLPIYECSY